MDEKCDTMSIHASKIYQEFQIMQGKNSTGGGGGAWEGGMKCH